MSPRGRTSGHNLDSPTKLISFVVTLKYWTQNPRISKIQVERTVIIYGKTKAVRLQLQEPSLRHRATERPFQTSCSVSNTIRVSSFSSSGHTLTTERNVYTS